MNYDIVIVLLTVTAAVLYIIRYAFRKHKEIKKMYSEEIGPCGHACSSCPFGKWDNKNAACSEVHGRKELEQDAFLSVDDVPDLKALIMKR